MPKLLVFAPCARLITSQEDSSVALIGLMEIIEVGIEPDASIPEDAFIPTSWSVLAMWYRLPEDKGKNFEQQVQVLQPDGRLMIEGVTSFQMTQRTHRNVLVVNSFNISQPGEHLFRLAIREADADNEWHMVAEYPMLIKHKYEAQK